MPFSDWLRYPLSILLWKVSSSVHLLRLLLLSIFEDLDKYFNYLYKNNLDCSLSISMRDRSILQNLTSQQTNYQLDRIVILLKVSYLAG